MRLYIIDERFNHNISIVEAYDEMFDDFSQENYQNFYEE
jgi:hypothetical protein